MVSQVITISNVFGNVYDNYKDVSTQAQRTISHGWLIYVQTYNMVFNLGLRECIIAMDRISALSTMAEKKKYSPQAFRPRENEFAV